MAYMRGHFYIWSDGDNVHFHHGSHAESRGHGFGEAGSVDENTLCAYAEAIVSPTSVTLPMYIVEEFVAMHWAKMSDEERGAAVRRVIDKYGGGNFSADAVMEAAGLPTVMDVVKAGLPESKS